MRIGILVLDDVFDTGLALLRDTLEIAAALAVAERAPFAPKVTMFGVRRNARTHLGMRVDLERPPRTRPDVIVVPALGAKSPDALHAALARADVTEAGGALATHAAAGSRVLAACTATFVLGHAGLLDGRRATTTWWLAPYFRERFPNTELDETSMIVESDRVVTAGAALAHLDLALWLIRQSSPTLANTVAGHLLHDARTSQAPYVIPDYYAHADPLVVKFERYARAHLVGFSMPEAARAIGASERTLERRISAVMGRSPLAYVRDLRVDRALHLLRTSAKSVDDIAAHVGYEHAVTLRNLLRDRTGRGVRELRRA